MNEEDKAFYIIRFLTGGSSMLQAVTYQGFVGREGSREQTEGRPDLYYWGLLTRQTRAQLVRQRSGRSCNADATYARLSRNFMSKLYLHLARKRCYIHYAALFGIFRFYG
ncbi:hypothetical protein PoB_002928800 [Plakobranchus ocellatus]|uniref:Uncharacterized protein n=1 Tax=Plakobranchus ocellatus TaxID=259542 RepID=A0AAV4A6F1_9GAST|nr:hypothetical protein PoB_002928800 [Plakobranchus ocellatus]